MRAAAQTFRNDGSVNVEQVISQLAVGEALCSFLDEAGSPLPVEVGKIAPPRSRLGAIADAERQQIVRQSPLFGHYEKAVDRESAYELLKARATSPEQPPDAAPGKGSGKESAPAHRGGKQKSWMSEIGGVLSGVGKVLNSRVTTEIIRGVLGSHVGGSPPRRRR